MAKLTREERIELARLTDIDYDAYEELTPEQLVRYRELSHRYEEELERMRDYADDRYEDFRDED